MYSVSQKFWPRAQSVRDMITRQAFSNTVCTVENMVGPLNLAHIDYRASEKGRKTIRERQPELEDNITCERNVMLSMDVHRKVIGSALFGELGFPFCPSTGLVCLCH